MEVLDRMFRPSAVFRPRHETPAEETRRLESHTPPRAARPRRWFLPWGLVLWAGLAAGQYRCHASATEYEVKAAWLLNFAKFTDWPANAFAESDAPLVIGVLGKDPFGPDLECVLAGKTAKGRTVEIRRVEDVEDGKSCHVLFISASEKRRQREILESLNQTPILTIGESEDFDEDGGMIQFLKQERTVRFSVNLNASGHTGLRINPKLLGVAVSVRGKPDLAPASAPAP